MSKPSWRGQIHRALSAIDRIGESKYQAKKAQDWKPGEAVVGLFSFGYKNTVFDRAITFTNWLGEHYPDLRLFREVDQDVVAEYLSVKAETCTPDTVRMLIATMQKLQEGLLAMNWIAEHIVPDDWQVNGRNSPRGPYAPDEAETLSKWVSKRNAEYGQALRFILSSGARIDETLHLRSDKVFVADNQVELIGKGGRSRRIRVLHGEVLGEFMPSRRFVFLPPEQGRLWKEGLRRYVRAGCDTLGIHRRGVHGFRGTAACEFVEVKKALGHTELEARRELAQWLGHNPHRTEVTYAYEPRKYGF